MLELVDTGMKTETRRPDQETGLLYLGSETFMLAWGDGIADINLHDLLAFHRSHGKLATLTAVRPAARFGHLELEEDRIIEVSSKPQTKEGWDQRRIFCVGAGGSLSSLISGDDTHFEKEPLERLAAAGQLMAYRHGAFWQCMDTLHEKRYLDRLWESGKAPWKTWPACHEEPGESLSQQRGRSWKRDMKPAGSPGQTSSLNLKSRKPLRSGVVHNVIAALYGVQGMYLRAPSCLPFHISGARARPFRLGGGGFLRRRLER